MVTKESSYEEKLEFLKGLLKISGSTYNNKFLNIIFMTAHLTKAYRQKNPKIVPYNILANSAGKPESEWAKELYDQIGLITEIMLFNNAQLPTFDVSAKQMMLDIKDILDDWIPF